MINKRTFQDLELERIFNLITKYCLTEEGKGLFSSSSILNNEKAINERASYIEEIISHLVSSLVKPTRFPSLKPIFEFSSNTHASMPGEMINAFSDYLASLKVLSEFLEKSEIFNPYFDTIIQEVHLALDSTGNVLDTHPLVAPAIKRLESERNKRYQFSQSFIQDKKDIIQNDNPVYRNERVAIPIKAEAKNTIGGYVQGASSSGNTYFIEPFALVELNNNVSLYEDEIRRIKLKVLFDLSNKVRSVLPSFKKIDSFVLDFDFHYSLARFVEEFKMERCKKGESVNLLAARHPLLGKSVVPITLTLDDNIKAVVLSGANAGGKTVSMKTVAVMAVLNQLSGFIPAMLGSSMPFFDNIYTDIGDGQSIEESVSTFSSHMKNVSSIVKNVKENDLVLLDELGTGTDPEEGAALSVAVLEELKTKAKLTLITSHYVQVKSYAYVSDEILNASMEFSGDKQTPTFRIIAGLPGDSHALEIASKVGLDKAIIQNAKSRLSSESNSISKIIADLKGKTRALDRKMTSIELQSREMEKLRAEIEEEKKALEKERYLLKKGKSDELSTYLIQTRRELEALVKEVKLGGTIDKEKTKKVKDYIAKVTEKEKEVKEEVQKESEKYRVKPDVPYRIGDEVLCGTFKKRGILLEPKGKGKWLVGLDSLKMVLKEENFTPAPKEDKSSRISYAITTQKPEFVLDVRGLTLAETLEKLDTQIEGCIVHNLLAFSIIHGYGDGILSRGVHEYLKKRKEVKNFYFARPEDGGMGKTYVEL